MGHAILPPGHGAYERLVRRLNRFPQGAPPSERLFQILRLLVSEEEAGLLAQVPIRPFTARRAATLWGLSEGRAHQYAAGAIGNLHASPPAQSADKIVSMVDDDLLR